MKSGIDQIHFQFTSKIKYSDKNYKRPKRVGSSIGISYSEYVVILYCSIAWLPANPKYRKIVL